jgi:nucleotide-binding universal stress UspA family protein
MVARVPALMALLRTSAQPAARQPTSDPEPAAERRPHGAVRLILLATDLTPVSDRATGQAIDFAASLGARLLIVNVIDDRQQGHARRSRVDQARADREPILLEAVNRARARGVEATYLLWNGEPGRSIVAAAEAEQVDMIVVGTRGLDRAGRFLLGSVSDHVVYHAACPVLVAR